MPEYTCFACGETSASCAPYSGFSARSRSAARWACPAPVNRIRFTTSGCASRLLELGFFAPAQLLALHLAGGGHRQRIEELDLARVFVRREAASHVVLDFFHQGFALLES